MKTVRPPHGSGFGPPGPPPMPAIRPSMNPVTSAAPTLPRSLRCFIVEDSAIIRNNLIATLEEMLAVSVVGSAEDEHSALPWLRDPAAACDLMIVDIFLKSGSGLAVLREARALRPQARLAVLTNYATADMRRRCEQLGADRVFDKSAELEELLAYCGELALGPGA